MKKFFSKNYALFIFSLLVANAAYSQNASNDNFSASPTVNLGGFINANAGFRSEDGSYGNDRLPDAQVATGVVNNATGSQNRMTNNPDFTNEAEIHIKVAGINEFGMKYGAVVELEGNTSNSARNEGVSADKAYIFTESRVGKLELGNNSAVNHKMKVGPETFARGAGGINGKYLEYVNLPMLADSTQVTSVGGTAIGNCDGYRVDSNGAVTETGSNCANVKLPRFILIPESPIAHGGYAKGFYNRATDNDYEGTNADADFGFNKNKTSSQVRDGQFGDLEDASKISYYTPRISGWQFGASFAPDTGNNGTSAAITGDNSGDIKQAISFGVNYSDNFGNLGFAASATAENGQFEQVSSTTIQRNDLQAYDVGLMITYLGVTAGASYGNWGDSLQPVTGIYSCNYDEAVNIGSQDCTAATSTKFGDATYYTAGLSYQFGPIASSITYLDSTFQENTYNALSIGVDYRMAKGLMPYLEVTKYDFQSNQPKGLDIANQSNIDNNIRQLRDNNGYVVLAGLLFSF
jgi:hypothetical protein